MAPRRLDYEATARAADKALEYTKPAVKPVRRHATVDAAAVKHAAKIQRARDIIARFNTADAATVAAARKRVLKPRRRTRDTEIAEQGQEMEVPKSSPGSGDVDDLLDQGEVMTGDAEARMRANIPIRLVQAAQDRAYGTVRRKDAAKVTVKKSRTRDAAVALTQAINRANAKFWGPKK